MPVIWPLSIYFFYLAILPAMLPHLIPCMNSGLGTVATINGCPATRILDEFILFSLLGSGVLSSALFITLRKNRIVVTTIFIILTSISAIISYYLYSGYANQVADKAPVILYDPNVK